MIERHPGGDGGPQQHRDSGPLQCKGGVVTSTTDVERRYAVYEGEGERGSGVGWVVNSR